MTRSHLLCKFDYLVKQHNWTGKELEKHAYLFWNAATLNKYEQCPFPEYLVLFAQGRWEPFTNTFE